MSAKFASEHLAASPAPWPLLAVAAAWPTLMALAYFTRRAGSDGADPIAQELYVLGKAVQFGGPLLWLWWVGWGRGALPVRPRSAVGRGLVGGLAFALAVGAVVAIAYGLIRGTPLLGDAPARIREKLAGFGVTTPARFLLLAVFLSALHSGLEEYYWRWFVHGGLRRRLGGWALPVSSLAFAAHHVVILAEYLPGRFWIGAVPLAGTVAVGGAVWAWLYDRTGSLAGPWLSHALVDAALLAVGYDLLFG